MKTENLTLNKNGKFEIKLKINNEEIFMNVLPYETLLDALRRYGYKGAKKGCDTGDCGSCAVLMDSRAKVACLMPAFLAHKSEIITIEGLGTVSNPHILQETFVEEGAVQCGYCIPAMIIASLDLINKNKNPDEKQIKHALDGNLCRCTGYVKQIQAVKKAAAKMAKKVK